MFGFRSVDSIVANFEKKVSHLRQVQSKHSDKATFLSGAIEELKEERGFLIEEAKRAAAIANKIENLIAGV